MNSLQSIHAQRAQETHADAVERVMRMVGDGARIRELASLTGLTNTQVLDAIVELEERGAIVASTWRYVPEAARA